MNNYPTDIDFFHLEHYYKSKEFREAIYPYVTRREIAFLPAKQITEEQHDNIPQIRNCQITNKTGITFLADFLKYTTRHRAFCWYMSLAQYRNGLPKAKLGWKYKDQRREELDQWYAKDNKGINQSMKDITYYEYVIDIDPPDHSKYSIEAMINTAQNLRDQLKKEGHTFFIVFSGMGFHFYIKDNQQEYSYIPHSPNEIYREMHRRASHYESQISEFIDCRLYDNRRLIKIPYSISIYGRLMYQSRPLSTPEELDTFELENYSFNHRRIKFDKPYIYQPPYT